MSIALATKGIICDFVSTNIPSQSGGGGVIYQDRYIKETIPTVTVDIIDSDFDITFDVDYVNGMDNGHENGIKHIELEYVNGNGNNNEETI